MSVCIQDVWLISQRRFPTQLRYGSQKKLALGSLVSDSNRSLEHHTLSTILGWIVWTLLKW